MADKVVYPADSVDDYWHTAIQVLTGMVLPKRETLFGALLGNDDIPMMRVEFSDYDGEPSNAIVEASDDLNWLYKSSGWRVENTDVVIPFYSGKHGKVGDADVNTKVVMKKARITMLGTTGSDKDDAPAGGVFYGGEFKSGLGKDFQGQSKDTVWSNKALSQYAFGGGMALQQLLDHDTTSGYSWNDLPITEENAVDLKSFEDNARAFDRVAQFFQQRYRDLQDWEFDLGKQEAAWKGQAAGVFKDLIHGLVRNYKSYNEQFPVSGATGSKYGDDLRAYRVAVRNSAQRLHDKWDTWATLTGNPLRWLLDILSEVAKEVWHNNITKVRYKPVYSPYGYSSGYHYVKFGGFYGGDRKYGPLEDKETWKKIGEEAIRRWQQSVKDVLQVAGKKALIDIENAINDQKFPKKIETETVSLTEKFNIDQAAKEKADAKKEKEEAEKKAEEKEKEAERKAEEKEKEAERKAEEAEKRAEERQREAEERADKKQKEAEQRAEEKEKEQERKQEEKEKEQEAKQAEQERKQEEKEKEQERKQEEKEKEQEAKQAEQEQKQAEKEAEQEAKQEEKEKEQEAKQAEQEAKQEEKEKEQEQKQAEQEQKQEQKEKEAEERQIVATNQARADRDQEKKEQERKQAEQEQKQAQKEAEQEQKQAEQERKQEEKEKEAEQKQAEKEKEQEQKQAEQEAKQEQKEKEQEQKQIQTESEYQAKQEEQEAKQEQKEKEQEQKQQEAEQKAEQKQAEQEAKQEQLQQEQEQKQAEQEAKQEQKEKEAEQKQAAAEQKAEQQQKEAEERYARGLGGGDLPGVGDLPGYGDLLGQDSATTTLNPDGSVTMDYPDGTSRTIDVPSGDVTTTLPDGSTDIDSLRPGDSITNSDGSTTTLNPDGTVTTDFPDGGSSVLDPDRGTITSHQPDGTTITTPIDPGQTLPSELGGPSGLGGGPSGLGNSGDSVYSPSYDGSGYEEELFDDTPGSMDPSEYGMGTGNGAGGMPMMPGRMGGMGGGGSSSDGERVRAVMDDGQTMTARRSTPQTSRGGYQDEETIPVAGRGTATTSGGMPFMPPMGGAGGPGQQQTQSGDRERSSWVEEDDDVWGTDEGGAPAVIGR
ncbi:AAWKG family protein [Streptomyces milbemycinicus]|uniref:AAWKG family protein n=1 Tax=Streptomyces milbemycinicus TaxID=476552 RepID=UPI003404A46A